MWPSSHRRQKSKSSEAVDTRTGRHGETSIVAPLLAVRYRTSSWSLYDEKLAVPGCSHSYLRMQKAYSGNLKRKASRAISTARLNALLHLHLRPIKVVVYNSPTGGLRPEKPNLGCGFTLRCFQRFSIPHIATRQCRWRDSRYTRGASVPVLSY